MTAATAPWHRSTYQSTYLLGRPDLEFGQDYRSREYCVRATTDDDHPMICGDADDALRRGYRKHATCIVIISLSDGRKWIFAERSVSFLNGYKNTDEYAKARLAANERAKVRLFGGAQ
jgi:hypothetical protein